MTWETALYHDGNVAPVMARSVLTATPFTWVPRASGDKVAEYLVGVAQGGVDVGSTLGTWGQLRVGAVYSRVHARVDTGSPLLPSLRETTAGVRANLFIDQTDAAWFPREGYGVVANGYAALESFGSAATYQRLDGTALNYGG